MARVLIVAGLAALAFTVFAVVDCALAQRGTVRALPRWAWVLLILVLPVVGGVLWLLIGSGRAVRSGSRPLGPDDDPAFLRGRIAPPAPPRKALPSGEEAEWRRLEQELAKLDSDADPEEDGDRR